MTHTFPPIAAVGIYRTLRFMDAMPSLGWEGIVLAMKEEAVVGHPIDPALCDRIPSGAIVERVGVWRPLDRFIEWLKSISRWFRPVPKTKCQEGVGPTHSTPIGLDQTSDHAPARGLVVSMKKLLRDLRDVLFYTPDNCANWIGPAVLAGFRLVRRHRPKVILSSGPPHSAHVAGLLLYWISGVPWIVDLRDPWASDEWLAQEDFRLKLWLQKKLEKMCVRFASGVILNTERLRTDFVERYPSRWEHKFVAIPNGIDDYIKGPVETYLSNAAQRADADRLTLCHPGSIYRHRSLLPVIEAVKLLKEKGSFVFLDQIGNVSHPPDLADRLASWGLKEVRLHGRQTHEYTLQQMAVADVLIVIQPLSTLQIPAKLYEMLVFHKPLLVLTEDGATADVVGKYAIGKIANPNEPKAIADAIEKITEEIEEEKAGSVRPGDWHRAIADYDSRNLTSKLVDFLQQCSTRKRGEL